MIICQNMLRRSVSPWRIHDHTSKRLSIPHQRNLKAENRDQVMYRFTSQCRVVRVVQLRRWGPESWDGQGKDEAPLFYQGVDDFTEKARPVLTEKCWEWKTMLHAWKVIMKNLCEGLLSLLSWWCTWCICQISCSVRKLQGSDEHDRWSTSDLSQDGGGSVGTSNAERQLMSLKSFVESAPSPLQAKTHMRIRIIRARRSLQVLTWKMPAPWNSGIWTVPKQQELAT